VDCVLGDSCYIQQFADHDPGPGAADFTCGPLSYDGHDGTDFALPTRAAMAAGVNVLAAALGTVKGTRDGVADFQPAIAGKECGNGVVIDHGDGWQTQYCHLKQGSVRVAPGDRVETGTPLGQIGQSGQADFPHLHLTLRKDGQELDPFAPAATACGSAGDDLWAPDIATEPGGLLGIGIAPAVPDFSAIKAGLPSPDLPADAPALVVWAYLFGPRAGDALLLSITGPEGDVITERVLLEKTQALAFRAVGRKLTAAAWAPGAYAATATLIRGGQELDRMALSITLQP
jgi:murein DD-endopeptidase MepM/ murein hydrolase activator NlpD